MGHDEAAEEEEAAVKECNILEASREAAYIWYTYCRRINIESQLKIIRVTISSK